MTHPVHGSGHVVTDAVTEPSGPAPQEEARKGPSRLQRWSCGLLKPASSRPRGERTPRPVPTAVHEPPPGDPLAQLRQQLHALPSFSPQRLSLMRQIQDLEKAEAPPPPPLQSPPQSPPMSPVGPGGTLPTIEEVDEAEEAEEAEEAKSTPTPPPAQDSGSARRTSRPGSTTLADLMMEETRQDKAKRGNVFTRLFRKQTDGAQDGRSSQAKSKPPSGLGDWAYAQGLGVTQTRVQLTPFRSSTTSAPAKSKSTVVQGQDAAEAQAARPAVPKALAALMAPPQEPTAAPTGPVLRTLQKLKAPESVQKAVEEHFPQATPAQRETLLDTLVSVREARALSAPETALVAKELALGFSSPTAAAQALHALHELPLLAVLRDPTALGEPTPAEQAAWKFAADLQRVPGQGLDLVCRMVAGPLADDRQRGAVRAYFEAARVVGELSGDGHVDPASMYQRGRVADSIQAVRTEQGSQAWPGRAGQALPAGIRCTLAEKALLAVPELLSPEQPAPHGCRFAAEMLRSGMATDDVRDARGNLTEYGKVEQRARKAFGKHVDRALRQPSTSPLKTAFKRYLAHTDKTPFRAYESLVAGAPQDRRFGLSHRGGIQEARAMKDMVEVLESALATQGPAGTPMLGADGRLDAAALADPRTLQQLARLATLETVRKDTVLLTRMADGQSLDERGQERALSTLTGKVRDLVELGEGERHALQERAAAALKACSEPITPQLLQRWAEGAGRPAPGTEAAPGTHGGPDWSRFDQALARAAEGQVPRPPTPSMQGASRQDVAAFLGDMIRGEELGSGFTLSNGGFSHFSTRNAAAVLSNLLTGGLITARLDLGAGGKRLVNFDSGVNTDRSFLRVGVTELRQMQAGAGGAVGMELGEEGSVNFTGSVGLEGQYLYEVQSQEGTVFGFPRHLSGGVGGDRDLAARKAQLLELLVDVAGGGAGTAGLPRPGNPEDGGSLVKAALQAFGGDLSIGRYEVSRSDHLVGGGVTVGMGAGFDGEASLGGTARLGANRRGGNLHYEDLSGWFRIQRDAQSSAVRGNLGGTLAALSATLNAPPAAPPESGTPTEPPPTEPAPDPAVGHTETLGLGAFGSVSSDVFRAGKTETLTRIHADGRELPTSYVTISYDRPAAFVDALAKDFDRFAEDKARKYYAARHAEAPAEAVAAEKKALAEYASRLLTDRDMSASPMLYYEWGDKVPDANLLAAEADLARRQGDPARAKAAERDISRIHSDPALREGRFLVTSYGTLDGNGTGLLGLGGLTHAVENRKSESSIRFT